MARTENINPITRAPVSPIKILDGSQLKVKKENTAPAVVNASKDIL